jgi:hypothetical protein
MKMVDVAMVSGCGNGDEKNFTATVVNLHVWHRLLASSLNESTQLQHPYFLATLSSPIQHRDVYFKMSIGTS